jgi:hypothetical protein
MMREKNQERQSSSSNFLLAFTPAKPTWQTKQQRQTFCITQTFATHPTECSLSIWIPAKDAYACPTNYVDIWKGELGKNKESFLKS